MVKESRESGMNERELGTPYQGAFVGRTHHFALRVYFEDTDTAGIGYL